MAGPGRAPSRRGSRAAIFDSPRQACRFGAGRREGIFGRRDELHRALVDLAGAPPRRRVPCVTTRCWCRFPGGRVPGRPIRQLRLYQRMVASARRSSHPRRSRPRLARQGASRRPVAVQPRVSPAEAAHGIIVRMPALDPDGRCPSRHRANWSRKPACKARRRAASVPSATLPSNPKPGRNWTTRGSSSNKARWCSIAAARPTISRSSMSRRISRASATASPMRWPTACAIRIISTSGPRRRHQRDASPGLRGE